MSPSDLPSKAPRMSFISFYIIYHFRFKSLYHFNSIYFSIVTALLPPSAGRVGHSLFKGSANRGLMCHRFNVS